MSGESHICDRCIHAERCRMLLGYSYSPCGPCDWEPPRFRLTRRLAPVQETDGQQRWRLLEQGAAVGDGEL